MPFLLIICLTLLSIPSLYAKDMVSVSGGTFLMGDDQGEADEKPQHRVTISSYRIDRREVSNKEYTECVAAGRCSAPHYQDKRCFIWTNQGLSQTIPPKQLQSSDHPVVCVSWTQARDYCRFRGKRLPTEAEWEYGASGGGKTRYTWGNNTPNTQNAHFKKSTSSPVSKREPSGRFPLADMHGNVWEWVNDRYDPEYYAISPEKNPSGAKLGRFRTIRGGGWYSGAKALRATNRHWFTPESAEVSIGFRCAK